MDLPVDERLLMAQFHLTNQREEILTKKRQLYGQFRAFALNKLKTYGQPFQVKFRAINGDVDTKYRHLSMGEDFFLEYGSFIFDPKTSLITNYVRNEFKGTKTEEDFNILVEKEFKKLRRLLEPELSLNNVSPLEKGEVRKMMQQKVDEILLGIFSGKLGFSDPDFKALVTMNIALEKELQELNTRIGALNIINNSSGVTMTDNGDEPLEPKPKL